MHVGTEKPGSRAEGGPGAGSTPHEVSADGRFLLRLLVQNSSFPDTPDSPRQLRQAACCRPYRFALHLASNLFPSKLLMYTQIRMGQKSCKMHPKAASRKLEWPSAAEDGRRLAAALDALGALDAQAGNLHRGEKYRAHGSTKLSAPGRAGLAGSDARLPANEMTRTSLGPSGAISVRSDQASRVG